MRYITTDLNVSLFSIYITPFNNIKRHLLYHVWTYIHAQLEVGGEIHEEEIQGERN